LLQSQSPSKGNIFFKNLMFHSSLLWMYELQVKLNISERSWYKGRHIKT